MRKDLLELTMAKALEMKGRFYYGLFVGEDWEGNPDLSCGTTACMAGWATTIPEVQAAGLYLSKMGFPHIKNSEGKSRPTICALAEVFGLEVWEANYLFYPDQTSVFRSGLPISPNEEASVEEVVEHFKRFIAWKESQEANEKTNEPSA